MAKKFGRRALAALLVYLVLGALLPYVRHREARELPASETWQDERVLYVKTNEEALTWRLRLIESAREELILSTFDFRADEAGGDLLAALGAAADRGVQVRVLVDGGNGQAHFSWEPEVRALAARENVQIRLYNPFDLLRPWSFNPRLHDKYLLADGKAYLLGGRNTNDLFLGEMGPGSSEDRDLLIWREAAEGGTPQALKDYFEGIWDLPCNRAVKGKAAPGLLEQRYQTLRQRRPEGFTETNWRESTLETRGVALICGSPLPENKPPLVWKQLRDRMEKGQDVLIQTPYIICGGEMYRDLADLSQGRSLIIATNAVESGLNPWGCADFLNQKGKILKTGVTVRALAGTHSVHTKSILIDDDISIVGSYNLDMRSTYLDTEMMVAVDCPALNRQLQEEVEAVPSRTFHPDGSVTESPDCPEAGLPLGKRVVYGLLQILTPPFRFLL